MCVDLIDNKEMSFFYNLLVVRNADIKFCLTDQKTLDVSLKGLLTIDQVDFTATVEKTGEDYTISASAGAFNIENAINYFRARFFPRQIREALKNSPFLNFHVDNPLLIHHIPSVNEQVLEISGQPSIQGYVGVKMDAILVHDVTNNLVVGLFIDNVPLDTLLHDVTQMDTQRIPMLNQVLKASVVISPATLQKYYLHQHRKMPIERGITVVVENMGFPRNCSSSNFCRAAKVLLGKGSAFTLQGTMMSASALILLTDLSDIDLSNQYVLQSVRFNVSIGEKPGVSITGLVPIHDPMITLSAEIEPVGENVHAHLSMRGCWNNPFGPSWLKICNLDGFVDLDPDNPKFKSVLDIGCEVRLGDRTCHTSLVTNGRLGVNAGKPKNSYYYAEFMTTKAKLSSLLKAFCWDVKLPRPLKESRFPVGFTSSYSDLEQSHPKISAGHRFKGFLEIIGLLGHADVFVEPDTKELFLSVELKPVSIANGLIKIYKNQDESFGGTSGGPIFRTHIALPSLSSNIVEESATSFGSNLTDSIGDSPIISITFDGTVNLFGTDVNTSLQITHGAYKFNPFFAKLVNKYDTYLDIQALYSSSLSDAAFKVVFGHMNDEGIKSDMYKKITEVFHSAISEAEKAIKQAEDNQELKQQVLEHVKAAIKHNRDRVTNAHGEYRAAGDGQIDAQKKVEAAFTRCRKYL